jgi:cytochrome c1
LRAWLLLLAISLGTLTACSDAGMYESGRRALADLGCGSCHVIPGIDWPRAHVGPPLTGFGERAVIAGKLPNTPENLASFVRNATATVPEGAMPSIEMTDQQARDIAQYLLALREDNRP